MISYSAIGSKVWKSVASTSDTSDTSAKINKEDISFLDFQVLNWHRNIPSPLKFTHPDSHPSQQPTLDSPPRALHRLQILLYLRANQMRILIYRPVLHTATTILSSLDFAHTVVKVAKDTIRILTHINLTSDIYTSQQTMFNYFLISALAVLFLAVAHAPAEFSATARDEFYMALDLVRGLSARSVVSKRLWRTVRMLKEVGPRLGLVSVSDSHAQMVHDETDAAVAMAGLAGRGVQHAPGAAAAAAAFNRNAHAHANANANTHLTQHIDTPHGMALDLTTLFEAAGGTFNLNGFEGMGGGMSGGGSGEGGYGNHAGGGGGMPVFGQENDELARIMKELF